MECATAHIAEFKAMLCPVVTESMSDIARISRNFPKKNFVSDDAAYNSRSDETHRYLKNNHRHLLYLTLISYSFIEKFPFIRHVDVMNVSEYDKLIIIMAAVGLPNKEVSNILLSDIRSVNTIRCRRKEIINRVSILP